MYPTRCFFYYGYKGENMSSIRYGCCKDPYLVINISIFIVTLPSVSAGR